MILILIFFRERGRILSGLRRFEKKFKSKLMLFELVRQLGKRKVIFGTVDFA